MAHYAYINDKNVVTSVIVGPNEGTEPEGVTSWEEYFSAKGKGRALRTSYNTRANEHIAGGTPFRGNYAGRGYRYDEGLDAFIPPQPHPSWVLNGVVWEAPVPYPEDGERYVWNENQKVWEPVVEPAE